MIDKFWNLVGGRTYFLTVIMAVSGIVLAFKSMLNGEYIALIGAVQGLMIVKAASDDYHERNMPAPPAVGGH